MSLERLSNGRRYLPERGDKLVADAANPLKEVGSITESEEEEGKSRFLRNRVGFV